MNLAWLGIDPGPSWTGLVLRHGVDVIMHKVLTNEGRHPNEHGVTSEYLCAVGNQVDAMRQRAVADGLDIRLAVEGVNTPRGHAKGGFVKPRDMIGLGIVFGWALGAFPDAQVISPNYHGQGLLAGYPSALVTAGELRNGLNRKAPDSSPMRHARSAWDVTLGAEKASNMNAARWRTVASR